MRRKISILCAMVMSIMALTVVGSVKASDNFGTLKVTFIRNKVEEQPVMSHVWGTGENAPSGGIQATSRDGVVYHFEYKIGAKATEMGFIPVLQGADGKEFWNDNKGKLSFGYANLAFDVSDIAGNGKVKHAVLFENAQPGEVVYSSLNPEYVVFLSYYAAAYEGNLGIHNWNWTSPEGAQWGTPNKIFRTVGRASDGSEVKGAILEASDINSAGLLIYAGGDDSKKHASHGDIKAENGDFTGAEKGVLYPVGVFGGNVYNNDMDSFVVDAFKFKFIGYGKDEAGFDTGTYATNKTNVVVQISQDIVIPLTKEDGTTYTTAERTKLAAELFTIVEKGTTNEVAIDHADFNQFNTTVKEFVIVLSQELDNTKEYVLKFDDGNTKQAEIELDLDKKGPEITLLTGSDVISVEWNKKFDMNLFPTYIAIDDRDGNVTNKVYVPKGKGYLNTNIKGDYPVTLCVEDKWGNVTEKVITFRVE